MPATRSCLLGLVVMTSAAAGCGGGDSKAAKSTVKAESTTTTSAPAVVRTTDNPTLGTILVDARGMTLYRNAQETGITVVCTGQCASVWPPLLVPSASALGIDLVATVTRPGGELQATYRGMPLYRYASDHVPGDTNGQGVGNIWFVVQADSRPAAEPGTTSSSTPTTAAATGPTTSRPTTASTARAPSAATTRPPATTAPLATSTTGAPPTAPPATAPPSTSPPVTSPPTTAPPYTVPPTTGGTCDYPPCYP